MSNLKIKDIETLETLSLNELEQVIGGKGRGLGKYCLGKYWGKGRHKWLNYGGSSLTASSVTGTSTSDGFLNTEDFEVVADDEISAF